TSLTLPPSHLFYKKPSLTSLSLHHTKSTPFSSSKLFLVALLLNFWFSSYYGHRSGRLLQDGRAYGYTTSSIGWVEEHGAPHLPTLPSGSSRSIPRPQPRPPPARLS
ncbi:hypothetical protein F2P56_017755, partial [Juglans regia]